MFHPEDPSRHDAICRAVDTTGSHHVVTMQFKLQSKMTRKEVLNAISNTDIKNSYNIKSGKNVNPSYKKRKLEAEKLISKQFASGTLRILFLFPYSIRKQMSQKNYEDIYINQPLGDVLVFLDEISTPDLFDKKVWEFLHNI